MWCARFTESQLETLKDLIRIQGEVGSDLEGALEALELARWDDLPEAQLPWTQVDRAGGAAGHQRGRRRSGTCPAAGRSPPLRAPRKRAQAGASARAEAHAQAGRLALAYS